MDLLLSTQPLIINLPPPSLLTTAWRPVGFKLTHILAWIYIFASPLGSTYQHLYRYRVVTQLQLYSEPSRHSPLCVVHRCLVYHLIHSSYILDHLVEFFSEQDYTFVDGGIESDLDKLKRDYGFRFSANAVDLRELLLNFLNPQRNLASGQWAMVVTME